MVLGLGSLLASVVQTTSSPLWAFYGLHTRLYEFIIGGAAALFWQWSLDRRTGRLFTIGGLAMIVAAFVWTPVDVGFPGAWPLLAVIGSVAMILGFTHGPREQGFSARDQSSQLWATSPLRWQTDIQERDVKIMTE